jgi:hypothetical protein
VLSLLTLRPLLVTSLTSTIGTVGIKSDRKWN